MNFPEQTAISIEGFPRSFRAWFKSALISWLVLCILLSGFPLIMSGGMDPMNWLFLIGMSSVIHIGAYSLIGLLTTIGLSTKNAILIIQFIKEQMNQGHELVEATLSAIRIRLRPVIMTSLAFFFGTLPLALTTGAGAAAQNAIDTAVTGGLLSATFIDLIFIPFFFVLISRRVTKKKAKISSQPA